MIHLLPWSWRVRIYEARARRDQVAAIKLRAKYPMRRIIFTAEYWKRVDAGLSP